MKQFRFVLAGAVATLGLAVPIAVAPTAHGAAGCNTTTPALGATVTCSTAGTDSISIPWGTGSVTVTVIGGGGSGGKGHESQDETGGAGGNGAKVIGTIALSSSWRSIDVVVGAPGRLAEYAQGGSGGGYSAVLSGGAPLVVAGGGGGGGGDSAMLQDESADGGDGSWNGTPAGQSGGNAVAGIQGLKAFGGGGGNPDGSGNGGAGGLFEDEAQYGPAAGAAGQSWSAGGTGGAGGGSESAGTFVAGGGGAGYGGGGGGGFATGHIAGGGAGGSYAAVSSGVTYASAGGTGPGAGAAGSSGMTPFSLSPRAGEVTLTFNAKTTYDLSYNGNGATGGTVPTTQAVKHGSTATVSGNTGNLANAGYSFAGWNTAADGSGVPHQPGSVILPLADTVLYAQWKSGSVPAIETSVYAMSNRFQVVWRSPTGLGPGEAITTWSAETDSGQACQNAQTTGEAWACDIVGLQNGKVYTVTARVTTSLGRTLTSKPMLGVPLADGQAPPVPNEDFQPNGWRAVAWVDGTWAQLEVNFDPRTGAATTKLSNGTQVEIFSDIVLDRSRLQMVYGNLMNYFVNGFARSSYVATTLFSKKYKLGSSRMTAAGAGSAKFTLPKNVPPGKHTMQVNGYSASGLPVTVSVPVQVLTGPAAITKVSSKKAKVQVFPICRSPYAVTVQKKSGGGWVKALSTKTKGTSQTRTLRPGSGTFRAKVAKKCGNPAYTTKPVKIG